MFRGCYNFGEITIFQCGLQCLAIAAINARFSPKVHQRLRNINGSLDQDIQRKQPLWQDSHQKHSHWFCPLGIRLLERLLVERSSTGFFRDFRWWYTNPTYPRGRFGPGSKTQLRYWVIYHPQDIVQWLFQEARRLAPITPIFVPWQDLIFE